MAASACVFVQVLQSYLDSTDSLFCPIDFVVA